MKLWAKASAIVVCILLLVVGLYTLFALEQTRISIVYLAMNNAQELHQITQLQLQQETKAHREQVESEVARRSLLQYITAHRLQGNVALMHGDQRIYASIVPYELEGLYMVPLVKHNDLLVTSNESTILIGSELTLFADESYTLYTAHDIRLVGKAMQSITNRLLFLCAGGVLLGALLVVWLMRRATKPLSNLAHTARRIAHGKYDERVASLPKDEIGQLAADFNTMADAVEHTVCELRAASDRQTSFIRSMSHEMKTPITAIVGHAETLLYTSLPDALREDALAQIIVQGRWVESLSKKLLQLMVANQPVTCTRVAVPDLISAVKEAARGELEARGVRLEASFLIDEMTLDMDLMISALVNLIHNAARASQTGQTLRLQIASGEISVTDHGGGIAPEHLEHVLEPFYMTDPSRNKANGGFGLGLSIVESIAKAHGARLIIESTKGMGTCARILLDVDN